MANYVAGSWPVSVSQIISYLDHSLNDVCPRGNKMHGREFPLRSIEACTGPTVVTYARSHVTRSPNAMCPIRPNAPETLAVPARRGRDGRKLWSQAPCIRSGALSASLVPWRDQCDPSACPRASDMPTATRGKVTKLWSTPRLVDLRMPRTKWTVRAVASDSNSAPIRRTLELFLRHRRCRTTHTHTHFSSTSHVFSCTTHQSCFQNLLLRCNFVSSFGVEWKQAYPWCAACISLSCHTCSGSSSISQVQTAQLHSQHFPLHLHCYHARD